MNSLREIASLGRAARMESKLKVRQPLAAVTVALNDPAQQEWLAAHDSILRDELNVKQISFTADAAEFVTYQIQPNFKRLGPQVGPLLPKLKATLQQANGAVLLAELNQTGAVKIDLGEKQLSLGGEDIQVRMQAKGGWAAAQGSACVVVLDTKLTDELVSEGYAQDVKRLVQDLRKQRRLDFSARIKLSLATTAEELRRAVEQHAAYLKQETLAVEIDWPARWPLLQSVKRWAITGFKSIWKSSIQFSQFKCAERFSQHVFFEIGMGTMRDSAKRRLRLAVLISGGGTTLRNLLDWHAAGKLDAEIVIVGSSNPDAGGLRYAAEANVPAFVVSHREVPGEQESSDRIFAACREAQVDYVVLGGFLRKLCIPSDFARRVINIHPSLIPAFAGKGFYGRRVHEAVLRQGCRVSGCTVHFVDDLFDHGPIIDQEAVRVAEDDTPETLAARVFAAECQLYPTVINRIAAGRVH
jgi:formyltetrahydrofolate-dependent phosphoribosylglycinamide formyltransferase